MQFDRQRAFPYPVLRPDVDDYTDGEFQVIVDIQPGTDEMVIQANIQCALSVPEIEREIDAGRATFAIVVSCRSTYYREVLSYRKPEFVHVFPKGSLRGEVHIKPYVIATRKIAQFSCEFINSEFGPGPFQFQQGSVLALDEPKTIYIDRDVFKPITSIFELVKDDTISGSEWRLRFNQSKVAIALSPDYKETIDLARNSTRNKAVLINSLYFAAVIQCLRNLREGAEFSDCRWAQVMKQKCHNLGINLSAQDEYLVAQQLMKYPLGLLNAYVFGDASND